jgi:hypothetical protein
MKIIILSKGEECFVSDEDYDILNKHKWYARKSCCGIYAARGIKIQGVVHIIRMHRVITDCPDDLIVHHKDTNGLNNQRDNLEIVTTKMNAIYRNMEKIKTIQPDEESVNFVQTLQQIQQEITQQIGLPSHLLTGEL